jgi:hypothetical protein
MPRKRGIYKLPSGSLIIKVTLNGVRYNLGTYRDEDEAEAVLKAFHSSSEAIIRTGGVKALLQQADETRKNAAKMRQNTPPPLKSRENEAEKLRAMNERLDTVQQENDRLFMRVSKLENQIGRLERPAK